MMMKKRGAFENLSNNHICKIILFQDLSSFFGRVAVAINYLINSKG
jgi:hypothetical protein